VINNKRILAVIPARGGSKRLPRKNVLNFAGKPLIAWSIEAALQSKYIDRVVVSTDDNEIAKVSKQYGADVPFMRPPELARDAATSIDTVLDAIRQLENMGDVYHYVLLLQPTSPLRGVKDIDGAVLQLDSRIDSAVVSVCESEHSPAWSNTLPEDRSMVGFISEDLVNIRSQDLPNYYRLNGAVYISSIDVLTSMSSPSFLQQDKVSAFVMPQERSIDIDSIQDFRLAQITLDPAIIARASLSDRLLQTYTNNGFGKLLKSQIDLEMFDFSVAHILTDINPTLVQNGDVDYILLTDSEIYEISKRLKLKENRVKYLIEEQGLLKGKLDGDRALLSFLKMMKSQLQDEKLLRDGKGQFSIPNRLMRTFIEHKVLSFGGVVEYFNNKSVVTIDLLIVIKMCNLDKSQIDEWVSSLNLTINDDEKDSFMAAVMKKKISAGSVTADVVKAVGSKLVGDSLGVLAEAGINKLLRLISP